MALNYSLETPHNNIQYFEKTKCLFNINFILKFYKKTNKKMTKIFNNSFLFLS